MKTLSFFSVICILGFFLALSLASNPVLAGGKDKKGADTTKKAEPAAKAFSNPIWWQENRFMNSAQVIGCPFAPKRMVGC